MANNKGSEAKVTFRAFNKDYTSKIKENVEVGKTYRQELKLSQEQLKTTGTNVDKLSTTLGSLTKQYDVQKNTTELTRTQLELVKKQFGENSEAAQKMEKTLRSQEIAEQQLANRIAQTEEALKKAESAQDGYISKYNALQNEQDQLKNSADKLGSEYRLLQETTLKNASEADKFAAAQKYVAQQSDLASQKIDSMERQLTLVRDEFGKNSNEANQLETQLNEAKLAFAKLGDEINQVDGSLNQSGESFDSLGDKIQNSNLMQAADNLSGIGDKLIDVGSKALESAMDVDNLSNKFNMAFGLTGDEATKTKDKIVNLYKTGFVDTYEEAEEALSQTKNQLRGLNAESLEKVTTTAVRFSKVFDSDMNESLRGVNALMTSYGMTAEEAFDLMTVGAQNGLNKTDELGDNLAEYAIQFKQNGYSAKDMFETLQSGLDAGAYNLDKVNDLVKEMGIRISDGSIASAVEDLGGEWQDMYTKMKDSGATNEQIFESLASKIANVGDETQKATLVSTIFGSLGEDNAVQVIEAMSGLSTEVDGVKNAYDNVKGASEALNEATDSEKLTQMFRDLQTLLLPLGEQLLSLALEVLPPILDVITSLFNKFSELPSSVQSTILIFGVLMALFTMLMPIIASFVIAIGAIGAPWTLIIIGIMAFIAVLITLYSKFEWFRNGVNTIFGFIGSYIKGQFDAFIANLNNFYNAGKSIFMGLIDFITGVFSGNWSRAWQGVVGIFKGIFSGITAVVKTPLNTMIGFINGFIGGVNKIKIPKWVPGVGGKNLSIPEIPFLAKGGRFRNGMAIVGEAGPELVSTFGGSTKVTPLSSNEKSGGILSAMLDTVQSQDFTNSSLNQITDMASVKLNATDQTNNSQSRLEYLLEMLIQVVEEKDFSPTIVTDSDGKRTGFDKKDYINKSMSAAEAIARLGFN
ncbi:phage tail tape measure protein [Enterococcus sulfureus]